MYLKEEAMTIGRRYQWLPDWSSVGRNSREPRRRSPEILLNPAAWRGQIQRSNRRRHRIDSGSVSGNATTQASGL